MRMMLICNKEMFAKTKDRNAFGKNEMARSNAVELMKENLLMLIKRCPYPSIPRAGCCGGNRPNSLV